MKTVKNNSKKLYVGIDVSTTTIGIGFILIQENKIINIDSVYYSPRKFKNYEKTADGTIEMLFDAKNNVLNMIEDYSKNIKIEPIIAVEDIILYMPKSTAQTTTILSAINKLICVSCLEKFKNVKTYPVMTIRSNLRKLICLDSKLEKQNVPLAIEKYVAENHMQSYKYHMLTSKTGKIIDENYDMADAIAVALINALTNKDI